MWLGTPSTRTAIRSRSTSSPGYLSGITNELGARNATFAYNSSGEATSIQHYGGVEQFTLSFDGSGGAVATDAHAIQTSYGMQAGAPGKQILGSITRNGATRTFTNEMSGQYRLLSTMDERGITTTFEHVTYCPVSIEIHGDHPLPAASAVR